MVEKYNRDVREEYVEPERGCLSKFGSHCRRFWWLHLILFSLILITILLPLYVVSSSQILALSIADCSLG